MSGERPAKGLGLETAEHDVFAAEEDLDLGGDDDFDVPSFLK